MNKKLGVIVASIISSVAAMPAALAQTIYYPNTQTPQPVNINGYSGVTGILNTLLGYAYSLFFIIAMFFFLWAAFVYLTAAGNEEKIKEAKNRLMYGIIAIIVAVLAYSIPTLVGSIL
ncbi:MAG: pilin [Patescibacteria group bacterium]|nr:pilin [Patescibacteria group bacterium]MCL5224094.1 pilin [Patescibacteria group bacterium]